MAKKKTDTVSAEVCSKLTLAFRIDNIASQALVLQNFKHMIPEELWNAFAEALTPLAKWSSETTEKLFTND